MQLPVQPLRLETYVDTAEFGLYETSGTDNGVNLQNSRIPLRIKSKSHFASIKREIPGDAHLCVPYRRDRSTKVPLWKIRLQAPSPEDLDLLIEMESRFSIRLLPLRIDIALDLVTDSVSEAKLLSKWVQERIVQLYRRGDSTGTVFRSTKYSNRRRWGRSIVVVYGDRVKRGRPACHLEFRAFSARQCRHQLQIRTVEELRNRDVEDCWRELLASRLRLEEIVAMERGQMGRFLRGQGNRKKPDLRRIGRRFTYDRDQAIARWAIRLAALIETSDSLTQPRFSTQSFRDVLRMLRRNNLPKRLLRREDDPFLFFADSCRERGS